MKMFDRSSSIRHEASDNKIRSLKYAERKRADQEQAKRDMDCDYDLPGRYCRRSTDDNTAPDYEHGVSVIAAHMSVIGFGVFFIALLVWLTY